MIKRLVSINDIKPDKSLKREDGWNRMDVQWLCTKDTVGTQHVVLGRTIFPPNGASHEMHVHTDAEEIMYIVSGHGKAISGDEEFEIGPGDVIFVPKGDMHYVVNTDKDNILEMIWLYGGAASLEESGYQPVDD